MLVMSNPFRFTIDRSRARLMYPSWVSKLSAFELNPVRVYCSLPSIFSLSFSIRQVVSPPKLVLPQPHARTLFGSATLPYRTPAVYKAYVAVWADRLNRTIPFLPEQTGTKRARVPRPDAARIWGHRDLSSVCAVAYSYDSERYQDNKDIGKLHPWLSIQHNMTPNIDRTYLDLSNYSSATYGTTAASALTIRS